jgi:hypothetical protein
LASSIKCVTRKVGLFPDQSGGVDHWLECLRSCSTPFRRPRHKHRPRTFGWSALRIVLHPQLLSVEVRISGRRGDFCGCLAVDFVRKTVSHRQASLCTWLESYTVTARSSQLPAFPRLFSSTCTNRAAYSGPISPQSLTCARPYIYVLSICTRIACISERQSRSRFPVIKGRGSEHELRKLFALSADSLKIPIATLPCCVAYCPDPDFE